MVAFDFTSRFEPVGTLNPVPRAEYRALPPSGFKRAMGKGVDIGDYVTKPCKIFIRGEKKFTIVLTEGKKHQIRRMCGALGQSVVELTRTRIATVELGSLLPGERRAIEGAALKKFLGAVGLA